MLTVSCLSHNTSLPQEVIVSHCSVQSALNPTIPRFGLWPPRADPAVTPTQASGGGCWLIPKLPARSSSHFPSLLAPSEPTVSQLSSPFPAVQSACASCVIKTCLVIYCGQQNQRVSARSHFSVSARVLYVLIATPLHPIQVLEKWSPVHSKCS